MGRDKKQRPRKELWGAVAEAKSPNMDGFNFVATSFGRVKYMAIPPLIIRALVYAEP